MQGVQETRKVFCCQQFVLWGNVKLCGNVKMKVQHLSAMLKAVTWQRTGSICLSLDRPLALVLAPFWNYELVWLEEEICLVIKSWVFFQLGLSSPCPYAHQDSGSGLSPWAGWLLRPCLTGDCGAAALLALVRRLVVSPKYWSPIFQLAGPWGLVCS